ncbi:MAG: hypothetical protein IPL61_17090 [Myxococcales bacterium]|nr:hypothetical protein [Myxococcales bacterium]
MGVVLLGPRAYDPAIGRFLQRDPIAILARSTTANPYAFSFNDPVNHADPTGLSGECADGSCAGAIVSFNAGAAGAGMLYSLLHGGGGSGGSSMPAGTSYGASQLHVAGREPAKSVEMGAAERLGWGCFGAPCDSVLAASRQTADFNRAHPAEWVSRVAIAYDIYSYVSCSANPGCFLPRLEDGQREERTPFYLFPRSSAQQQLDSLGAGPPPGGASRRRFACKLH